jgi:adenine-specific DNA glycosylase
MKVVPQPQWTKFAQRLIWHGRRVCDAKAPDCDHCVLAPLCPSAFRCGMKVERAAVKAKQPAKAKAKPAARPAKKKARARARA